MDTTNSKKMYGLANLCLVAVFLLALVSKIGYHEHLPWLNIAGLATALVAFVGLISIYIHQARKNNHWLLHVSYVILLIVAVSILLAATVLERSENSWLQWSVFVVNALLGLMLFFATALKEKPFMQEALAKFPFTYEVLILYPLLVLDLLR